MRIFANTRVLCLSFLVFAGVCSTSNATAQNTATLTQGSVGVGTYNTISQFKDLQVSVGEQIALQKTLAEGVADFEVGGGQWKVVDGTLQQSDAAAAGVAAFTGDRTWTDYVVSVKARKVTGKEGFMLVFRARDPKNFAWLNIGGWGNTRAQFEITANGTRGEIGDSTPMKVDEDRWYEVKVDVKGDEAIGYLDGAKVAWAKLVPSPPAPAQGNRGRGQGGGPGRQGGGGAVPASAAPIASVPASGESTLLEKTVFVGITALAAGLVVVVAFWAKNHFGGKSA